jgi:uncharacterized protein YutE (UPF0331/DUF86 family)
MVDKQKTEKLFSELDEYLISIGEMAQLKSEEYLRNKRNVYSGRYLLQISIETCINIGNHIVSRMSLGLPKEYADTFRILNKSGIISENLLERLLLMTKFRNRIVHLYWDIDDRMVLEILRKNSGDFAEFREAILHYLKRLKG